MPFGKYGGKGHEQRTMEEVPAKYLLWLWNTGLYGLREEDMKLEIDRERMAVRQYVEERITVLMDEDPDTEVKGY